MSTHEPPRNATYHGPAELIQAAVPENNVFDRRGMPGGQSFADHLTEKYGPEGTGWGVEAEQYADENDIKDALHAPEFTLATEAFRNVLAHGRYELDDGTDVSGKVQRYARHPDTVNVVKYPDGAHYAAERENPVGPDEPELPIEK